MEKIISNPGLQHLVEKVFWNLDDVEDLKICAQINKSCQQILQFPLFCLRKFEHLSKDNRKDWTKVIYSVKNPDQGIAIISYLKWNLKKEASVDLLCYSKPDVQEDFRRRIREISMIRFPISNIQYLSDEETEMVKILAPLTDNPNAPDKDGFTPIFWAARKGHTDIVKILAPLTDSPNAQNKNGSTPIIFAARHGHTDIVKILAPLLDNPNAPNNDGDTPIYVAARYGHTEIVKILAFLTDNPNAPNKSGRTPSSVTKNPEIQRFLESYNPSGKSKSIK